MSDHQNLINTSETKKMNRFSFLGSLGTLGAMSVLASGCSEQKVERIIYDDKNKNAIIDNLLTRRSIRKYTDQEVASDDLEMIMRCAIFAPSAINAQPWEVRVIQNTEMIKEITKRHAQYLISQNKPVPEGKNYSVNYHAPIFIVIARDVKGRGTLPTYLDCGIILQNIMLAAHGLNLGTCPLGGIVPFLNRENNADLLRLFNIPEHYEIAIAIALGHPDEQPEAPIRYTDKVKIIR